MEEAQSKSVAKRKSTGFFTQSRINGVLLALSVVYFIISIMSFCGILLEIFAYSTQADVYSMPGLILFIIMCLVGALLYIGLRRKKFWVVYGIYLLSIFAIVNHIMHFSADFISIIFLAFFIFQLYFFFLKDVRTHFYMRGLI
jgi:hypothetical protein